MNKLVPVERRHLARLGHGMKPVVHVGREGVTPDVVDSTSKAIEARELIKVKLNPGFEGDRHEAAESLAERTHSQVVMVVGKTFLLFKPLREKGRIVFPPQIAAKAQRKRDKQEG